MKTQPLQLVVLGANGQLGKALERIWRLNVTRTNPLIPVFFPRESVDLTNFAQLREAVSRCRPAIIVNCAAYTNVAQAEEDVRACWATNAQGVANLGRVAAACKATLIHVSSDRVFGHPAAASFCRDATSGFTELDTPAPCGQYGASKLAAEAILARIEEASGDDFRYVVFRPGALFEPAWRPAKNFLFALGSQLHESRSTVLTMADSVTTICSTEYLAKAIDWAIDQPWLQSRVYHIAHEGLASWHEISALTATLLGHAEDRLQPVDRSEYARRHGLPMNSIPAFVPLCSRTFFQESGLPVTTWRTAVYRWATAAASSEFF